MMHSCKACAKRKHCIYKPTSDVADCGYFVRGTQEQKQTNVDRIRSMSDEELAKFLRETVTEGGENLFSCSDYEDSPACKGKMCLECGAYLEWLKSEVKE